MQADLFTKYNIASNLTSFAVKKSRDTERGNLMKTFMENLNVQRVGNYKPLTMPRMGLILKGKTLQQLYQLASLCKQEAERKPEKYFEVYSKVFWFTVKK